MLGSSLMERASVGVKGAGVDVLVGADRRAICVLVRKD